MKTINEYIDNTKINENSLIKKVLEYKEIKDFINNHSEIQLADIENHLIELLGFIEKNNKCKQFKSLNTCQQNVKGKKVSLDFDKEIEVNYVTCAKQAKQNIIDNQSNLVKYYGVDASLYQEGNLYLNDNRITSLDHIRKLLIGVKNNEPVKGLYLYGQYGVGKTYLMMYLAKELKLLNKSVIVAYYPDLVRKIKSSIATPYFETIIEELKTVDFLILDDFGGETQNAFIRDEVLCAILQHRMIYKLPLLITSNLSIEMLRNNLCETKSELDIHKAGRIIERIKALCDTIKLQDINYRD